MKRQTRKQKRSRLRKTRRQRKRVFSRLRVYKGGADLPVPEGSVIGVDLDPKDPYSVPVLISKSTYEDEILED